MKKNKALIGTALALLIAPTVLSNLSPQTVSAADVSDIGLVGTVNGSGVLVDDQGQTITSTFLPNNSSWKLGNSKQINGITYYQVATNEWIAANSLNISNQQAQTQSQTTDNTILVKLEQLNGRLRLSIAKVKLSLALRFQLAVLGRLAIPLR